jgi:hypothetical protein
LKGLSDEEVSSHITLDRFIHPLPASNGTSEKDQPAAFHEEIPTDHAKQDQVEAAKPSASGSATKEPENVLRNPGFDKRLLDAKLKEWKGVQMRTI